MCVSKGTSTWLQNPWRSRCYPVWFKKQHWKTGKQTEVCVPLPWNSFSFWPSALASMDSPKNNSRGKAISVVLQSVDYTWKKWKEVSSLTVQDILFLCSQCNKKNIPRDRVWLAGTTGLHMCVCAASVSLDSHVPQFCCPPITLTDLRDLPHCLELCCSIPAPSLHWQLHHFMSDWFYCPQ